jgi:hypothetical protein
MEDLPQNQGGLDEIYESIYFSGSTKLGAGLRWIKMETNRYVFVQHYCLLFAVVFFLHLL